MSVGTVARTSAAVWHRATGVGLRRWLTNNGVLLALIVMCVVFATATSSFLSTVNLENLAQQSAVPGLLACGMTVVIIVGEFDLSVGAILGFAGVSAAAVANSSGLLLATVVAVAVGAGFGLLNGSLVARLGIQSFLATLAMQFIIVGAAIYLTAGTDTYRVTNSLGVSGLADGTLLGVEYKAWIALGGFVLVWLLLSKTRLGREIFAVGGNAEAARLCGVEIRKVITFAFIVSGLLAGLAGVLTVSDTGVAQADVGVGSELTAIAAVVIGGTNIAGGRGSVWRTLVGVMLLGVVADGFTLLYINPTYDQLVQGAIILGAIFIDSWLKRETVR